MTILSRRASRHLGTVALAAVFAGATFAVDVTPTSVALPRPDVLQPETASAGWCADTPAFTGRMTASATSTTAVSNITDPDVYGYLSNIDDNWSCTAYFRHSGFTWNTTSTLGKFDW